jgi:tetratricopeptide (TPR) repeat protein
MKRWLWPLGLLSVAVLGIGAARAPLVRSHQLAHTLEAVYALPNPEHLKLFSLGYRSALADLLFGRTLVAAGMHFSEKKVFENLDGYLHAIVALEPRYRDVYYYADSLLTLSTVRMPARNYRIARDLQERGRRLFPDDAQLWISSGQFMTYLAVQWLPEDENADEWRRAGAAVIQHACDIWPYQELPTSCIGITSVLSRLGEREATIRSLERLIAVSDDVAVRAEATRRIEGLLGEQAREQFHRSVQQIEALRALDLPLLSRTEYQLVGPPWDVTRCAGAVDPEAELTCRTSFALMR